MDSEDENFLEGLENDIRDRQGVYIYKYSTCGPDLRFNHNTERHAISLLQDLDCIPEALAAFRLPRFLQTVCGFHTGSLDLTGRHGPRYISLMKRWSEFSTDIQTFKHLTSTSADDQGPLDDPDAIPAEFMQAFDKRWRLGPFSRNLMVTLVGAVDQISSLLTVWPKPILQQICLQDLPPELLHYTMALMDQNTARRLGSTSRLFRQISISYVYRHRLLVLKSLDYNGLSSEPVARAAEALLGINQSKQRLMEQMQHIIDDTRLLDAIQSLHIGGNFQVEDLETAGIVGDSDDRRRFYGHLVMALGVILSEAVNTRTLTVHNWDLSPDLVPAILSLPSLHSVDILFCRIWPGYMRRVESPVLNARIAIDGSDGLRTWTLISGMPHLRVLSVMRGTHTELPILPPPAFTTSINPFKSVERLFISRLLSEEVYDLASWILDAKAKHGKLRLTHFKLVAGTFGLTEIHITTLLSALSGSPMKSFSLDGIHHATPDLLTHIGHAFPELESLSLHYRQSFRQQRTRSAYWPGVSWEYAKTLSLFPKLKHFMWNQMLNLLETTPFALKFMEDGWPSDTGNGAFLNEADSCTDWESIVKLFGVYAPSLQTVTFTTDGQPLIQYSVTGRPDGTVEKIDATSGLARRFSSSIASSVPFAMMRDYDPDVITATWPRLFSPAPADE